MWCWQIKGKEEEGVKAVMLEGCYIGTELSLPVQDEDLHGSSIQWDGLDTTSSGSDDKFDISFIFERNWNLNTWK